RGVEIKGLVIVVSPGLDIGPFSGDMEIWTKWTTESLELPSQSLVAVEKLRWLRKFDTSTQNLREIPLDADEQPLDQKRLPAIGCNVELTRVRVSGKGDWWTFGFESFGTIR